MPQLVSGYVLDIIGSRGARDAPGVAVIVFLVELQVVSRSVGPVIVDGDGAGAPQVAPHHLIGAVVARLGGAGCPIVEKLEIGPAHRAPGAGRCLVSHLLPDNISGIRVYAVVHVRASPGPFRSYIAESHRELVAVAVTPRGGNDHRPTAGRCRIAVDDAHGHRGHNAGIAPGDDGGLDARLARFVVERYLA